MAYFVLIIFILIQIMVQKSVIYRVPHKALRHADALQAETMQEPLAGG
jgi:hypothetical protein